MSGIYKLEEVRLVQLRNATSAANAELLTLPAVPAGKLWILHSCYYAPSAAETQTVSWLKGLGSPSNFYMTILNPISLSLDPARYLYSTPIEQGMEIMLLPGEFLAVARGNHTAGSTMSCAIQFTEIDLPLYTYDEPQVVKRQERVLSTLRSRLGGGLATSYRGGPVPGEGGGSRRGSPLEK